MKLANAKLTQAAAVLATALFLTATKPALAQNYPPPPSFSPQQLDALVGRIALYPDPLLAQVLAAASFPDQIPDAARWADDHRNLNGDQLASAMYQANLPFDPAVQALIPFPTVLDMLAQDPNWTAALGNAVLAERDQVMDAVQRMRRSAEQYGYLQNNAQLRVVNQGPIVEIEPINPALICVPVYNPLIVFAAPRPGFFVGGAIGFGPFFSIGAFGNWGWGGGFNWYNHSILVNHVAWGRTWFNRTVYVHNYGNWDRGAWRGRYAGNHFEANHFDANHFAEAHRPEPGFQNRGVARNEHVEANHFRPVANGRAAAEHHEVVRPHGEAQHRVEAHHAEAHHAEAHHAEAAHGHEGRK
jgi:hypothetical protein